MSSFLMKDSFSYTLMLFVNELFTHKKANKSRQKKKYNPYFYTIRT